MKKKSSIANNGGCISFKELEENIDNYLEKLSLEIKSNNIDKSNTYYRLMPERGTDFEEGKQYLVFMSYDEENDIYEITDLTYGIMEYDPATQMVKNIDTGEFVEIDWSLIK